MITKKMCVLRYFQSILYAEHFIFNKGYFLFKELSKIFKDLCGKFKDFSRISHYFSIFKDFEGHDVFFKDFSRPVQTMDTADFI